MEMLRSFRGDKHVLLSLSLSMFAVAQSLTSLIHDCISDVKAWATANIACLAVIKFKHVRSCPSFDITYT